MAVENFRNHVLVKFRGDGGPEYTGEERRSKSKRSLYDRVAEEIGDDVDGVLLDPCENTTFVYRKLTRHQESQEGVDNNHRRKEVLKGCIRGIALSLIEKMIPVVGLSEKKLREIPKPIEKDND